MSLEESVGQSSAAGLEGASSVGRKFVVVRHSFYTDAILLVGFGTCKMLLKGTVSRQCLAHLSQRERSRGQLASPSEAGALTCESSEQVLGDLMVLDFPLRLFVLLELAVGESAVGKHQARRTVIRQRCQPCDWQEILV